MTANDPIELNVFTVMAKYELLRRRGAQFQDFFVEVGGYRWGTDFEGRRPQGPLGDKKCDGYQPSSETVFQCYAPRSMNAKELKRKITEDFAGAFENRQHTPMRKWCLVHNDPDHLPTEAHELVIHLRTQHAGDIKIEVMNPESLLSLIMEIPVERLRLLFPSAISPAHLRRVTYEQIDQLIATLDGIAGETNLEPPTVPDVQKIQHNGFTEPVKAMLRLGVLTQSRFEEYFRETSRATVGDNLAMRFKRIYREVRQESHDGDELFFRVLDAVGGLGYSSGRRAAIIGLISYLFHTCEIFENPPA